jgi:hypothetical protein
MAYPGGRIFIPTSAWASGNRAVAQLIFFLYPIW